MWGRGFHCQRPWARGDNRGGGARGGGRARAICFAKKSRNLQWESFFFFHGHLQEKKKKERERERVGPFPKGGRGAVPGKLGGGWSLQKSRPEAASTPDPPRTVRAREPAGGRQSQRQEGKGGVRRACPDPGTGVEVPPGGELCSDLPRITREPGRGPGS